MHIDILIGLAKAYGQQATYLEIGVGDGGCFDQVSQWCKRGIAVDVPDNPYGNGHVNMVCSLNRKCHFYDCGSDLYFEQYASRVGACDLIFIDGSHHIEQVVKDFDNAREWLAAFGTIAMHDTWPGSQDGVIHGSDTAYRMAELLEDQEEEPWDCYTVPIRPGLTLCRPRIPRNLGLS